MDLIRAFGGFDGIAEPSFLPANISIAADPSLSGDGYTHTLRERGWHDELPDTGCEMNPSCLACPHPACAMDVGLTEAHRLALQAGTLDEERARRIDFQQERAERITTLLADGLSVRETADNLGLPYHTVYDTARVAGIDTSTGKYPPAVRAQVKELRQSGKSFRAIGREMDIPQSQVRKICLKEAA